ncbi:MAG: proline racemase family protein [Caldibacillus sp.]
MDLSKIFSTIDTHVAGEPFRIVTRSSIQLDKADIKSNHELLQRNFDEEKAFLLNEPRGHRGMSGCIVTPSKTSDYGLLFFSHEGVTFKYGGLVASLTALLETGNLRKKESGIYRIETIRGVYELKAKMIGGEVTEVFLETDDVKVIDTRNGYDVVQVDNSRTYILFPLPESIPSIEMEHISAVTNWGSATLENLKNGKINFDGYVVIEKTKSPNQIRTVTFEKDGSITRSPNIDSTIAVLAALRKKSHKIEHLTNKSIFGSSITVNRLANKENRFSTRLKAFITGIHEFVYDKDDPFKKGFILK